MTQRFSDAQTALSAQHSASWVVFLSFLLKASIEKCQFLDGHETILTGLSGDDTRDRELPAVEFLAIYSVDGSPPAGRGHRHFGDLQGLGKTGLDKRGIGISLAFSKKGDVRVVTISSGHDLFGVGLAADERVPSRTRNRPAGSRGAEPYRLGA